MDADHGFDLDAIFRVIDDAPVFVIRFSLIEQRLLVDIRPGSDGQPLVEIVPPVTSATERYRYLQKARPEVALPEQITVFFWPRALQVMRDLGVCQRIEARVEREGGEVAISRARRVFREAERLERADVVAAIRGGEGYETVWERPRP
ncbi:MAG: hypothetical protein EXR68_05580 [Dehalococcoidia bacterium]|nr:hypothetical protein [Dehalococcoidia bacterium]